MFKLFKKSRPVEYRVTYRWIDSNEIYESYGFSAGIASLEADPYIEILSVEKVGV